MRVLLLLLLLLLFLFSYDLVKYIHGQIESVVDPLVDERLKKHGGLSHGEEHDIVALITDDILTSPE